MPEQSNIQEAVRQFMTIAGQTTAGFTWEQASLYTGLQLEEMAEKLEAVATGAITTLIKTHLHQHADALRILSMDFKRGVHNTAVARADRTAMVDADFDLAWVALGGVFSTCRDANGAIAEGIRSNLDKFPGGAVIKDENGKVRKPLDWRGPEFAPYIGTDEQN